eukprot:6199118-Pleurochrysis_carterae.AAC.1
MRARRRRTRSSLLVDAVPKSSFLSVPVRLTGHSARKGVEKPTLTAACLALLRKKCESFEQRKSGEGSGGSASDTSDERPLNVKTGRVSGRASVVKDSSDEEVGEKGEQHAVAPPAAFVQCQHCRQQRLCSTYGCWHRGPRQASPQRAVVK